MNEQLILAQFDLIHRQLAEIRAEGSERGRRLWEQMDAVKRESAVMAHRLAELEKSGSSQSEMLGKYRRLEHQAEGAGWLGRRLMTVGAALISGAAALYAARDAIIEFLTRSR